MPIGRFVDPLRNVFRMATMLNGEAGAAQNLDRMLLCFACRILSLSNNV